MTNSAIGVALSTLRSAADATLDDVAADAGISVSYLSRAERGLVTPSANWVQVVASALGDRIAARAAEEALV